jgi:RhoGEF domain
MQTQCNRLKLVDLIVKPWQRLTKYKLLLHAVCKPLEKMALEAAATTQHGHGISHVIHGPSSIEEQKSDIEAMVRRVGEILGLVVGGPWTLVWFNAEFAWRSNVATNQTNGPSYVPRRAFCRLQHARISARAREVCMR